ncbi:flagellinolysin [Aliamphritea hakodatensis]|uniref:flagellinolysin n=1 Tax=Aliamphritea hakodatensis TaxID=2895352 RepID=UPI0022FD9B83|nr:flagellinolysin [Aliamphritea hakodatensis]
MALVINSNLASLNARRQLAENASDLSSAMERLSSGKRINSAKDDAAGLAIANRMTSQIRGLNQAVRNANDGISMLQVADGALDQSTGVLQRMRELSVQSASGTYSSGDRNAINAEFQQLVRELDRISETTSFNGQPLLDGSTSEVSLQVGSDAEQSISFDLKSVDSKSLGLAQGAEGLTGAQINIDSDTGKLAVDLSHAVKINGQSIGTVNQGDSLKSLVDHINNDIEGVSASTVLGATATSVGTGVLSSSDTLTLKVFDTEGSAVTYTVNSTNSLEELAEKITTKTGGRLQASLDESGKLAISSDTASTMLIQDSTSGSASGFNTTSISNQDIANIVEGLNNYWISEAEDRIEQFFGIKGSGEDISLNLFTDAPSGQLASVSWTMVNPATGEALDLSLNIDLADYVGITLPDGGSSSINLERVIAHEMVHAVMAVTMDLTDVGGGTRITGGASLPGWFTEGTAELIHGADARVVSENSYIDTEAEFQTLFDSTTASGSPSDPGGYSVAYLAAKMLQDDIFANDNDGIKLLFDELETGDTLDQAIQDLNAAGKTQFTDLANFEAYFRANGFEYSTGAGPFANSTLNLGDSDTGSIGGSDYGNPALDDTGVFSNTANQPAQDFNLIIPDQYSGTYFTVDAQLVLSADDGSAVTVTKAASGTDLDLANLGFREIAALGEVVSEGLNSTEQQTALANGDLIINDVEIAPVESSAGLQGKIDAINAATGETGVVASVVSDESFTLNSAATKAYTTAAAGISVVNNGAFGINGVGMLINANDTAADIAETVNSYTFAHNTSAYVSDDGKLHLFSDTVINLGDSVGGALVTELGFLDTGAAGNGSLKIRGQEVALSDLGNTQTIIDELNAASGNTGVTASSDENGQLRLRGNTAVQISLGDTNGLQTLNALGISFGVAGDENLTDADGDKLLEDEVFVLESRIKLSSVEGNPISVDVTENGKTATGLADLNVGSGGAFGGSLSGQNLLTASAAQKAIGAVDNALDGISEIRSELGAVINRLDFTISNLSNLSENAAAARSRILDADFASESAKLSRAQIIQQVGTAMLAQANAAPQQILSLLQ